MTNTLFQLRTSDDTESVYSLLRAEHSENSLTDMLYIRESDNSVQASTSITLNGAQWAELAEFAENRALVLKFLEEDKGKKPSSLHMSNRQVENMQEQNRIAAFEEKISLTRQEFYDAGSLGLRPWMFEPAVVAELIKRNEIVDSGIKVTPNNKTIHKITVKGKVQHRRFLGEED